MSNHTTALSRGAAAYVLIPVFLSRAFRLGAIYVRDDKGIREPGDLVGKRVGLQEFEMTAAVVVRGILRDEYGLDTEGVDWVVGGVEQPATPSPIAHVLDKRRHVTPAPPGRTLDAMLVEGEIDALVSLRVPPSVASGLSHIGRLFPDWRKAEESYCSRSGIFPIMHSVGVRKTLLNEHPWLARSLYKAFVKAKDFALAGLAGDFTTGLPWCAAEVESTQRVLGDDIWPYGIAANRKSIAALLRWSLLDGLQARPIGIDELFAPTVLDT